VPTLCGLWTVDTEAEIVNLQEHSLSATSDSECESDLLITCHSAWLSQRINMMRCTLACSCVSAFMIDFVCASVYIYYYAWCA